MILDWSQWPPLAVALAVFVLRATDLTLSTLRMLAVVRGRRRSAWVLGFIEATLFVTAFSGLLSSLGSGLNLLAFAAGFATGNVLGMGIEARIAPGHSLLRITSPGRAPAVADALRQAGLGATETYARGHAGTVGVVFCFAPRRGVGAARRRVLEVDPDAFLTEQNVLQLRGGWRP